MSKRFTFQQLLQSYVVKNAFLHIDCCKSIFVYFCACENCLENGDRILYVCSKFEYLKAN